MSQQTSTSSSFPSPNGIIDKISIFSLFNFGLAAFLTWGLHLEFMQPILPQMASFFGLLTPVPGPFTYELSSMAGGCWCLGSAFICLPALLGKENEAMRDLRHLYSLGVWAGFLLANRKFHVKNDTFLSSYHLVWLVYDIVMTVAHVKWVSDSKILVNKKNKTT